MNNYMEMETSGDSRWWEKTKRTTGLVIHVKNLTEWNNVEDQVKTKMRAE